MLIGTIDFYHFIPLSLTLTLPEGQHEAKANCFHFHTHLSLDQDEISCGDEAIQAEHPETTFE